MTKNLNWEILTKNFVTWGMGLRTKNLNIMRGGGSLTLAFNEFRDRRQISLLILHKCNQSN